MSDVIVSLCPGCVTRKNEGGKTIVVGGEKEKLHVCLIFHLVAIYLKLSDYIVSLYFHQTFTILPSAVRMAYRRCNIIMTFQQTTLIFHIALSFYAR